MTDMCLNLLTSQQVQSGPDALEKIWSLDNWVKSIGRVKKVLVLVDLPDHQSFRLWFDAGRPELDEVEVERFFKEGAIYVVHLIPPPGIHSLSATWWAENNTEKTIFARRQIIMDEASYTAELGQKMFGLLKENFSKLLEGSP